MGEHIDRTTDICTYKKEEDMTTGKPDKNGAEPVQLEIVFRTASGKYEGFVKNMTLNNVDEGRRRVTYTNCVFTGKCRVGAYSTLIHPVIKGELCTGGGCTVIGAEFSSDGVLKPGANCMISG